MVDIEVFKLVNTQGASATIINLGARVTSLIVPTKHYGLINTVLGYKDYEQYKQDKMYHGAIVGRYCNRISKGQFTLENKTYKLDINDGHNHMHGGNKGFESQYWQLVKRDRSSVHLQITSADGECGYPGKLTVGISYTLNEHNSLIIRWHAKTDKNTIVNITNHCYFNLSKERSIKDHYLQVPAQFYTPSNKEQIPLGTIKNVKNTIFNLTKFTCLQELIESNNPEIQAFGGLDHNWAYGLPGSLKTLANLYCPQTGLLLNLKSSLPGLQCYTGNKLSDSDLYLAHEGICLEAQFYPDSPNQKHFPSCVLAARQVMTHQIEIHLYEVMSDKHMIIK